MIYTVPTMRNGLAGFDPSIHTYIETPTEDELYLPEGPRFVVGALVKNDRKFITGPQIEQYIRERGEVHVSSPHIVRNWAEAVIAFARAEVDNWYKITTSGAHGYLWLPHLPLPELKKFGEGLPDFDEAVDLEIVNYDGERTLLSELERLMLKVLVANQGVSFTKEEIYDAIKDDERFGKITLPAVKQTFPRLLTRLGTPKEADFQIVTSRKGVSLRKVESIENLPNVKNKLSNFGSSSNTIVDKDGAVRHLTDVQAICLYAAIRHSHRVFTNEQLAAFINKGNLSRNPISPGTVNSTLHVLSELFSDDPTEYHISLMTRIGNRIDIKFPLLCDNLIGFDQERHRGVITPDGSYVPFVKHHMQLLYAVMSRANSAMTREELYSLCLELYGGGYGTLTDFESRLASFIQEVDKLGEHCKLAVVEDTIVWNDGNSPVTHVSAAAEKPASMNASEFGLGDYQLDDTAYKVLSLLHQNKGNLVPLSHIVTVGGFDISDAYSLLRVLECIKFSEKPQMIPRETHALSISGDGFLLLDTSRQFPSYQNKLEGLELGKSFVVVDARENWWHISLANNIILTFLKNNSNKLVSMEEIIEYARQAEREIIRTLGFHMPINWNSSGMALGLLNLIDELEEDASEKLFHTFKGGAEFDAQFLFAPEGLDAAAATYDNDFNEQTELKIQLVKNRSGDFVVLDRFESACLLVYRQLKDKVRTLDQFHGFVLDIFGRETPSGDLFRERVREMVKKIETERVPQKQRKLIFVETDGIIRVGYNTAGARA